MMGDTHRGGDATLRLRAESLVRNNEQGANSMSDEDIRAVNYELSVHQIELELQNTELRRSHAELAEARDRLVDLYDFAPVGYLTLDEQGRILEANLTATKLLGLDRYYLINLYFGRLIAQASAQAYYAHRKSVWESGVRQTCQLQLRERGAVLAYVELTSTVRDTASGVKQMRVSITDVTRRRMLELREGLNRRVLTLLNQSKEWPAVAREVVAEIRKWSGLDALGLRLQEEGACPYSAAIGFPKDVKQTASPKNERLLESLCQSVLRRDFSADHRSYTAGGSFWANDLQQLAPALQASEAGRETVPVAHGYASVALVPLACGEENIGLLQLCDHRKDRFTYEQIEYLEQLAGIIAAAVQRNRAQKLRQEAELAQKLMEALPCMAFLINPQTHEIVASNRRATEIGACAGTQCYRSWAKEETPCAACELSRAVKTGTPQFRAAEMLGRHWEMYWAPLSKGLCLHYAFDVTERTQLAERLRQSEKMEAIGQLAGGVAHDFNNQLCGILGYADMLKNRLADETLKKYAEQIAMAASNSAMLTQQLLAFARKGLASLEPVDLHVIIADVISILQRSIDKRIEVKQYLTAIPSYTSGDQSQLQSLLLNLGINAAKAMPRGGLLTLTTHRVTLNEDQLQKKELALTPGSYLEISVADTGVGMDEETLSHIFEPFFTTREVGEGTGMGLASAYGTIQRHHGAITVRSQLNKGSLFTIYLPTLKRHDPVRREAVEKKGPDALAHILVVDDEEVIRTMAQIMLEESGYEVTTAKDGQDAIEYYHDAWQEIDLVLLDMTMPRLNGRDTYLAMEAINPDLKVIMSSGYDLKEESQDLVDGGHVQFISKPYEEAVLSRLVAEFLNAEVG